MKDNNSNHRPSYEPAPPGRSKKRKLLNNNNNTQQQDEQQPSELIRLGQPINATSERLQKGWRPVRLSTEDKAKQITLDDKRLAASSSKGYCMVRATHGAHQGTWYYEAKIDHLGDTGAVRLGWATLSAELQSPVGADAGGYAIRSVNGDKVHGGSREAYGSLVNNKELLKRKNDQFIQQGDVIGCLLHMPPGGRPLEKTLDDIVRYRGQLYFVEDDQPVQPHTLHGSFIEFFLNGISLGKAYRDIQEGTYHPAISMYSHAKQISPVQVTVNFGDEPFEYSPSSSGSGSSRKGNEVLLIAQPVNMLPGPGLGDEDDNDE